LIAVLVIALIALGIIADALENMLGTGVIPLHKSLGITVFFLVLVQLGRLMVRRRPPPTPHGKRAWVRLSAGVAHALLYGFLLALPLTGYLFSSGGPYPLSWFGVGIAKLPVTERLADAMHFVHEWGGYLMLGIIILHVAAALWHHFFLRDRLIARMVPVGLLAFGERN
jgi:cytochrome b561